MACVLGCLRDGVRVGCKKQPGWKHFRPQKKFARPHPPGSRPSPECGHPDQPMTSPPTGCQRRGLRKECSLLGTLSNWVLATLHPEGQKAKGTPEATEPLRTLKAREQGKYLKPRSYQRDTSGCRIGQLVPGPGSPPIYTYRQ